MASDLGPNGSSPSEGPRRGVPYLPAALGVIGLVVLILAGGVLITKHFRTPVGTQAAPSIAVSAAPGFATSTGSSYAGVAASAGPSVSGQPATPQAEVEAAYLHYWDVYRQQAASGDTGQLPDVLSGDALKWTIDEINGRKAQGRGVQINVTHLYVIRNVTSNSAEVDDQYTDSSQWIDLKTGQVQPRQSAGQNIVQSFQMKKLDGVWKVISGTRDVAP